jgi:hypothetical protein
MQNVAIHFCCFDHKATHLAIQRYSLGRLPFFVLTLLHSILSSFNFKLAPITVVARKAWIHEPQDGN